MGVENRVNELMVEYKISFKFGNFLNKETINLYLISKSTVF